jgi:2-C-methyl-D-erythritol 2,4-cyclodiphosphate synthase
VGAGVRVGLGLDVHQFDDDPGRPLWLAGVLIPDAPGLQGHSDADVLLHAVVDALLGAGGMGDLGALFGGHDPRYAGAASRGFVDETLRRVRAAGWAVGNLDCTLVAQRPRLGPHRQAMTASLAELLEVAASAVNVKITSTDGLGFTGRGEGIAALATVLLLADPTAVDSARHGGGEPV